MLSMQDQGPNLSQISVLIEISSLSYKNMRALLKVSKYEVEVPFASQGILSRPIPVSMTLIAKSSLEPSGNVLYCMKTILPTSSPLTKYSIDGPRLPPPAQTSSTKVISSGLTPISSVSQL